MNIYSTFKKNTENLNKEILSQVSTLVKEQKSFNQIVHETNISLFDLGAYFEAVFGLEDINPNTYVSEEVYERLQTIIRNYDYPSLTVIKNEYQKEYGEIVDWTVLRIAKGVFYRNAAKSRAWQKKQEREEQTEFNNKELKPIEDNSPKKIDINSIPEFKREIDAFRTERWKTFGYYVFEKVCPLQFFVMPASMSKRVHSICEHSMGKINGDKVERLGGKAFHTIRVVEFLKKIMETDFSEVVTRKGTTYVYGNDYTDEEKDIQILAALCHDIYSGGEGDEFDTTRKSLDINHPYYHEKIFKRPDNIPENEWNLFIQAIRNHMWKWAPQKPVTFDEYNNSNRMREYRVIKNVELSDYLAAQQNKNIETKVQTVIELCTENDITSVDKVNESLEKLGITEKELKETFGHSDILEIITSLGYNIDEQITL